jgi:uncharacterized protein YqjF (DUF2071 family)
MNPPQRFSSADDEPDEAGLAVLLACHYRGPLSAAELALLLPASQEHLAAIASLTAAGLLESHGQRHGVTQRGRDLLDRVLEGIESQLTPDAPEYVRRYRRAAPTLPFGANTVWEEAVCVNVRLQPAALRPLIPAMFDLDLYEGHAFVSLTASRLKDFGVGWLPRALRMNFYQATYRAHVTYTDFRGRTLRGCYFVRSDTNSRLMSLTANLLPEFRAHRCGTCPMLMARQGDHLLLTVDAEDPAGKVVLVLDVAHPLPEMPRTSCFRTTEAACALLVDFYDAFAFDPEAGHVLLLQIERGPWDIRIVAPVDHFLGYFAAGAFPPGSAELDSVFYFRNTPYQWLPLLKERVKHDRA